MRRAALLILIAILLMATTAGGSGKSWAQDKPGQFLTDPPAAGTSNQEDWQQKLSEPPANGFFGEAVKTETPKKSQQVQPQPSPPASTPVEDGGSYVNKAAGKEPGGDINYSPPTQPVQGRERVAKCPVPVPHPPTIRGHHAGVGHSPVYQEIKKWNPASGSYVDARNQRNENKIDTEKSDRMRAVKNEARIRSKNDEELKKEIRKKPTSKDFIGLITGFAIIALIVIAMIAGKRKKYSN